MENRHSARRVMILGASMLQLPLIMHARSCGDYVITADNRPNNPGHLFAQESHNVSTTDTQAIVSLAERLDVASVMSFANDPAMPSVAAASSRLGLFGPKPSAIDILTHKGRFRALLMEQKLPYPRFITLKSGSRISQELLSQAGLQFPVIVKPTDSSGSRGVKQIENICDLEPAVHKALAASTCGELIIEECVTGGQVHGDVFLKDGCVDFIHIGDQYFISIDGCETPLGTRYPRSSNAPDNSDLVRQIEVVSRASGYLNGPMNIEARPISASEFMLLDVAPRNGGNNTPAAIHAATGFDLVQQYYNLCVFGQIDFSPLPRAARPAATYTVHSPRPGQLHEIILSRDIRQQIVRLDIFKCLPHRVEILSSAAHAIGSIVLAFESAEQRDRMLDNMENHVHLVVT